MQLVSFFNKRFSVKDFVLKSASLTDNEMRVNDVYVLQSGKVKEALVRDVVSIGSIRDLIHRLGVVNIGIGDMNIDRNLRNHIEERMSFIPLFVLWNFVHDKRLRQRSIVVESNT